MDYEIAAGPVLYIDEVCEFPHFKYRPWQATCESDYGTLLCSTPPNVYHLRTPHRVKSYGRRLGKDTHEIYRRWLGYGPTKVNELKKKGVV